MTSRNGGFALTLHVKPLVVYNADGKPFVQGTGGVHCRWDREVVGLLYPFGPKEFL